MPDLNASAQSITVIGEQIRVAGSISGDEDLSVFGTVEGTIRLSQVLIVEPSGLVKARVEARAAIISGVVVGDVKAAEVVEITSGGRMVGDIDAPRVIITDGAAFKGHITMPGVDEVAPQPTTEAGRAATAPTAARQAAAAAPAPAATSSRSGSRGATAPAATASTPSRSATPSRSTYSAPQPAAAPASRPAPPPARAATPAPPPPSRPAPPPPRAIAAPAPAPVAATSTATLTLEEGEDDPSGPPEPRGDAQAPAHAHEATTRGEPSRPAPESAPAAEQGLDVEEPGSPGLLPAEEFRTLGWNKARKYIKKHDIELEYTNLDELIEAYARFLAARA